MDRDNLKSIKLFATSVKSGTNDPVNYPRMDPAIKNYIKAVNAVDSGPWKGCSRNTEMYKL